jgi:Cell wall-active antibiotics response 4TMS YvqF
MTEEHPDASPNASPTHYRRATEALKPVLAVGAAVLVLGLVFSRPATLAEKSETRNGSDTFNDLTIMGGVKRTNLSKDFRGGEATAVMGGIDIDLRQAVMDQSEAVLDVSSVMGGVKIRVPEEWTVVSRVSSIMGGFDDNTRHPENQDHRLVLKGTVLMGGLKVTN